ncbi:MULTISPECIES: hypothetical protein [unclassified Mesorhizobium]|uniref:hypothetical protein n=1 Tax=unclassified Mesorhizobium TaxID=325217 RepID=UPI0003CF4F9D|nr:MULTISPECIES: hypothetical protein [unclassified Mesorhizobium]ESY48145.1 hypothetical protein X745_28945 [Mesorhizobium sp. LNJC374B00]ESY52211.1 hypothetical protein X744_29315 [Mesorhizobium sp. LNJC372A00]WJI81132.1 hypothetical protein NLY34_31490 [Mesorhizobium sp. C374B]WJI87674.1 hypothetical protein NLY42_02225 [Mesorhizobium sp. C372A]
MTEHHEAVVLILDRLKTEGLEWYRGAKAEDVYLFERRISGSFSIFDGGEIHTVGRKPKGSFPAKKILVMTPSGREEEAILGLWLRWNFEADPFEFRLFLGHWCEIDGQKTFLAFRFDSPEQGEEHNYYHCQPCRNFGDKELVPDAALVSQRFPTIPVNASNIVELTVCALMSSMGHKKMKGFVRKLLREPASASNAALTAAYSRCFA